MSCVLDAAINAKIWYTDIGITSNEFENLVDKTGCRHGSVIDINPALEFLGLKIVEGIWDLDWVKNHLPVAVGIIDPKYYNHLVLIEKVENNILYLINSSFEFLTWEELLDHRTPKNYKPSIPISYEEGNQWDMDGVNMLKKN